MQNAPSFDDRLCSALSAAKFRGAEIIGLLHAIYHDRQHIPPRYVTDRLSEARSQAEHIMVAIVAAEQALASQGKPAAANTLSARVSA